MDGSEVGPADGLDHFTVEVSVLQRHYGLCHRVVQEVGRSDKLEEYEMLKKMELDCIQGYYFGKPMSKNAIRNKISAECQTEGND